MGDNASVDGTAADGTAVGGSAAPTPDAKAARPEESRRDPGQTRADLQAWLVATLPEGSDPEITDFTVPDSNGMSSETVLLDATWTTDGQREAHPLVARIAPLDSAVPVFETYDLDSQFRTMAKVRELTDVPVPETHWLEEGDEAIGAPFFIMSRAYGVVPPDVMPYPFGDNWLYDASLEDQQRLEAATVDVLVELHGIEDPEQHFDFLVDAPEGDDRSPLRRHVDATREYFGWVTSDGATVPLLDRAFEWLEANWPEEEPASALSWGDARIGNAMFEDFEPVAVLDWEMASIAPREVDIAWMIYIHRFFQDVAAVFELDGMPHFMHRDKIVAMYEERSGYTPRDMDFHTLYAAVRYGVVAVQVKKRGIAFGMDEMPEDPDDMLMNRQALEEMLAGTYWDRVL